MKRVVILLVIGILLTFAVSAPVFAEIPKDKESEYFCITIPIEKVYPYRLGYAIRYRKGVHYFATTYAPLTWFSGPDSKGDLVRLPAGKTWPYMAVYYKNGEFSHVRLYVHRNSSHQSWGTIPVGTNIDSRFEDVEEIKLEF